MGYITQMIETAESYIGVKEGSKRYKDLIIAFERSGLKYDGQGCTEILLGMFVMAFGWEMAKDMLPFSNYALGQSRMWKLNKEPRIGSIIYIGSSEINHEELVIDIRGDKLTTIDGNFNHTVVKRTRTRGSSDIKGFGYPAYYSEKWDLADSWYAAAINSVTLKKGSTGELVLWLQEVLHYEGFYNGWLDGVFGDVLDSAVRTYQKKHGLLVDGVCAKYFWRYMLL